MPVHYSQQPFSYSEMLCYLDDCYTVGPLTHRAWSQAGRFSEVLLGVRFSRRHACDLMLSWVLPLRAVRRLAVGAEPHTLTSLQVKMRKDEFFFFNMRGKEVPEIFKSCQESVSSDWFTKDCTFSSKEKMWVLGIKQSLWLVFLHPRHGRVL